MEYEQELKDLCEAYGAALPEKLTVIQADWDQLKDNHEIIPDELIRKVHSLIGAGATFGFYSLSVAAKELEQALRHYQQESRPSKGPNSLEPLFMALQSAAQQPCQYDMIVDTHPPVDTANIIDNDAPSILIISSNQSLTTDLVIKLKGLKMVSHVINSSSDCQAMMERTNPECIVLELNSEQNPGDEIKVIKEIWGMHLTHVDTIYSIEEWKIIQGIYLN